MSTKYAQLQPFSLAGAGAIIGATTIVLASMKTIDGTNLAMTDFGSKGFITLEPGSGVQEEQISFIGLTQNSNGTTTISGVKTVLFLSPYTETSGLAKTHAGGTSAVVSNTAGFYNQFPAKDNDETITGQWTFNNTPIVPGTVSDASTTIKGVSKTSVAPVLSSNPITVGDNDPRVPVAYAADSVGTDAYAITPSPAITAYTTGQSFTFKAGTANTGAATLNVNALGAKTIKKNVSADLATGDILANQIVKVVYDGTNMQMVSLSAGVKDATQLTGMVPAVNGGIAATSGTVGPLINSIAKTYFNIQLPFITWTGATNAAATTDFPNWTKTSEAVTTPAGAMAQFVGTGSENLYLETGATSPFVTSGSGQLGFDTSGTTIIMDWFAKLPATSTGDLMMGFVNAGTVLQDVYNSTTNGRVAFAMQGSTGTIFATISKNGVGCTTTNVSSGITNTNWNNFRIEFLIGTSATFYINGVSVATLSGANLTVAAPILPGFGRSNTSVYAVTAPTFSIQLI